MVRRVTPEDEPPAAIRILLADDHVVVRRGLELLLGAEDGFEVVATTGDVDATIRAVRGHKPDVLVLDVDMPGGSGVDAIPRIAEASPKTRVAVLTMHNDPALARQALVAGAGAYVLKEAALDELVEAVRRVASGGTYLNPQLGARIAREPPAPPPPGGLSAREVEVLRMIAMGHTNAEIADQLDLSTRTVDSHRARIQQKLGLTSRAAVVRYALDNGVLEL
jgi:two-component system response regulator NreC